MVSADELLVAAEAMLIEHGDSEVFVRSSTSRGYYAAFHSANAFHTQLPLPGRLIPGPGGEHESLIQRLERPDAKLHPELAQTSRKIGLKLRAYRDLRIKADYKLDVSFPLEAGQKSLLQSKDIVSICKSGSARRSQLGASAASP